MKVYYYLLMPFLFIVPTLCAQNISPQVIGSAGGYKELDNINISYTVGECITTTIQNNAGDMLTQGFHQPLKTTIIIDEDSIHIYNGITPNADGQNDIWIIDNVADKNCNVKVFNRWGDLVWYGNNYNNSDVVWKGDNMHNNPLPAATYFYVITVRNKTYKGWVELTR